MHRFFRMIASAIAAAVSLAACSGGSSSFAPASQERASAVVDNGSAVVDNGSAVVDNGSTQVVDNGSRLHMHLFPQKNGGHASSTPSGPVTYHGGPIMPHPAMYAIFWQPTGTYMSALYKPTIQQFFQDVGNTAQFNILTQYYDTAEHIQNVETFGGAWTDTSPYPSDFKKTSAGDTDLHNEVLKAIKANNWPNGGLNAIFVVFTAQNAPDDSWAACAYHASFTNNSANVIYSVVPYQHDYGAQGCGTPSTTWPNDRDADQTIDTLWHEEAEATSDPITTRAGAAWTNATGYEIGDICETTYGPLRADGSNVTLNGHNYVTQTLWSNKDNACVQTDP